MKLLALNITNKAIQKETIFIHWFKHGKCCCWIHSMTCHILNVFSTFSLLNVLNKHHQFCAESIYFVHIIEFSNWSFVEFTQSILNRGIKRFQGKEPTYTVVLSTRLLKSMLQQHHIYFEMIDPDPITIINYNKML